MRQRLLLLVIAALLPLVALIGVLSFLSVSQKRASMRQVAISYSAEMLQWVSRELRVQRELTEVLARSPLLDEPALDLASFHEVASRFVEQVRAWDRVILVDTNLRQVVNTAVRFGAELPGLIEAGSFERALKTGSTVVSDLAGPGPIATDGTPRILIRTPIFRNGKPRYVLTVLIRPEAFDRAIAETKIGEGWRPFLVDGSERLIAMPLSTSRVGQRVGEAATQARASGLSGVYSGRTWDGRPVITAFQKSPENGWSAHISIPAALYNEPLRRSLALIGALVVIALGLSGIFAFIARRELLGMKAEAEVLSRASRMESLGRMTGGVAHDFNNLLMVVTTAADMLRRRNLDKGNERFLSAIQNAAERGARLTRELMSFSRGQGGQVETIEVGLRLASIKSLIRQSVTEEVHIDYRIPAGQHFVQVDPTQFDLSIINIVVNARDAMPNGGRIVVALERAAFPDRSGRSGLRLAISDNGVGIAPDDLPHVFEPFFTTKSVGKGTGLGLSQVYGFAKAQGGLAEITSELGRGTTISIYLPEAEAPAVFAPAPQPQVDLAWRADGLEAVVVDDSDDIRVLTGEVLADIGFTVRYASNASEAMALCEAGADLVVSDIVMPGAMDGVTLAKTIRQRWPDMQTILMTGYSEASKEAFAAGLRVLGKPFTREALLEAISTRRFDDAPRRRRIDAK